MIIQTPSIISCSNGQPRLRPISYILLETSLHPLLCIASQFQIQPCCITIGTRLPCHSWNPFLSPRVVGRPLFSPFRIMCDHELIYKAVHLFPRLIMTTDFWASSVIYNYMLCSHLLCSSFTYSLPLYMLSGFVRRAPEVARYGMRICACI